MLTKGSHPARHVATWLVHKQLKPGLLLGIGGWLWQQADSACPDSITFTPVSEAQPTEQQLQDLAFAWRCVKHVKSNAITVAKEEKLLGMGSGQPNRVKSVQIALEKAAQEVEVSWLILPLNTLVQWVKDRAGAFQ